MIEELTTEILAAEKKAYGKVIRMMAHEVNIHWSRKFHIAIRFKAPGIWDADKIKPWHWPYRWRLTVTRT
jgi:hypothetical protein